MSGWRCKCGAEGTYRLRLPEGIRDYCQAHWDERQRDRDDHLMRIRRRS